jgi:hypothetical protein
MTSTPSTLPSAVPLAVEDDSGRAGAPSSDTGSFDGLTGRLAEVAHAIRVAADRFEELPDLAVVFADVERALGDLAAAAELMGYAVIDRDRPPGASATQVSPTPPARALSWRLHGLAGALRIAQGLSRCSERWAGAGSRSAASRGHAPAGAHVNRQLRDPSA